MERKGKKKESPPSPLKKGKESSPPLNIRGKKIFRNEFEKILIKKGESNKAFQK
jgi:hypothetical protein